MKYKNAITRSITILIIISLSLSIGAIYNFIGHRSDLRSHPKQYSEYVSKYAAEYGVPEYIVYGVMHVKSNFQSNKLSDDGRIGLMQISPETFRWILSLTKDELEPGILYDPETNIKYGTYLLSYLYTRYSRWTTVFAIMETNESTVEGWLNTDRYVDSLGNLSVIPDDSIRNVISNIESDCDLYKKLYYDEK